MKKKILLLLILPTLLVTGCEEEEKNLKCTFKSEVEGSTTTSVMNIDFKGNKAEKITLDINIDYIEEYKEYADTFRKTLEDQRANLEATGYEVEITSGKNSEKLTAKGTYETLDESETTGSYTATKKSLEESGYVCE